jgi:uncharacterized protein (DUF433 family)
MERLELGKYVVSDPAICHGKLTFKGTRVLVEPVLAMFINGCNIDRILKGYPTITKEAIQEALRLAIHKLVADYPGAPQPWEEDVPRQAEEWEKQQERKAKRRRRKQVEAVA